MALNTLSLSVSTGVQGRPFRSAVIGLTAGSQVSLDEDAAPGFSFVNGFLSHQALPYEVSVAALRERLATGETKVTRLAITAATATSLAALAIATLPVGRTLTGFRVAAVRQEDGSDIWKIYVDDTVGATTSAVVGGAQPTVPTAPRNLTATPGDEQVTLNWQEPLTSNPAVTDYIPEFKLSANTVWQQFADGTSTGLSALVTGLANGSAYDFRVRAVNVVGSSDPSGVAIATPAEIATLPASPTAPSFTRPDAAYDRHLTSVAGITADPTANVDTSWYADGERLGVEGAINANNYPGKTLRVGSYAFNDNGQSDVVFSTASVAVPGPPDSAVVLDDDFVGPSGTLVTAAGHADPDFGSWVDAGQNAIGVRLDGNGAAKRATGGGATPGYYYRDVGSQAFEFAVTIDEALGFGTGSFSNFTVRLLVDGTLQNGIEARLTYYAAGQKAYTILNWFKIIGGTTTGANRFSYLPEMQHGDVLWFTVGTNKRLYVGHERAGVRTNYAIRSLIASPTGPDAGGGDAGISLDPSATDPNFPSLTALGTNVHMTLYGTSGTNWMSVSRTTIWNLQGAVSVDDSFAANGWPSMANGQSLVIGGPGVAPSTVEVAVEQNSSIIQAKRTATITESGSGGWKAKVQFPDQLRLVAAKNPKAKVYLNGSSTPIDQRFTPTVYAEIGGNIPAFNFGENTYNYPVDHVLDLTGKFLWNIKNPTTNQYHRLYSTEEMPSVNNYGKVDEDGILHAWPDGSTGASTLSAVLPWEVHAERVNLEHVIDGLPLGSTISIAGRNSNSPIVTGLNNGTVKPTFKYLVAADRTAAPTLLINVPAIPTGGLDLGAITILPTDPSYASKLIPDGEDRHLTGIKLIRFMQGAAINTSSIVPGGRNFLTFKNIAYGNLYPLEHQVAVCNAADNGAGAEGWVSIPRDATNEYVGKLAVYLRDHLNGPFTAEYSNERWNHDDDFRYTFVYCGARAYERGFDDPANHGPGTAKFRTVISTADTWSVPYDVTTLQTGRIIRAGEVFPINMDLSYSSGFASTGIRYVLASTELAQGVTLSLANVTVLGTLDTAELAKWFPVDSGYTGNVWQRIPSGTYLLLGVLAPLTTSTGWAAGNNIILTNQAIAAGSKLTATNCTYKMTITDVIGSYYGIVREMEINAIIDGVLGGSARTRFNRLHAEWANHSAQFIASLFQWAGAVGKFERYCEATYTSNVATGYQYINETNHGDPSDWDQAPGTTAWPGWTTTQKGLFASNPTAWKNGYLYGNAEGTGDALYGPAGTVIRARVNDVIAKVHAVEAAFRVTFGNVYTPNSLKMCSYETGWELGINSSPTSGYYQAGVYGLVSQAAKDAYDLVLNDPGAGDVNEHFYSELRDKVGNAHNQFTDINYPRAAKFWLRYSNQNNIADTASQQMAGFRRAHGIVVE